MIPHWNPSERKASSPPPLHAIVLLYYPSYLPAISKVIKKVSAIRGLDKLILVINNIDYDVRAADKLFSGVAKSVFAITHDNTGAEFGGYQRGLEALGEVSAPYKLLILNDTIGTHYPITKGVLSGIIRSLDDEKWRRKVTGIVDQMTRSIEINQLVASRWVRSNLLAFDDEAIMALDGRVYSQEIDQLVRGGHTAETFFSCQCDDRIRSHISAWLFAKDGGWYGAEPLSQINVEKLSRKARAILQEKYLAMRFEKKGIAIVRPQLTRVVKLLELIKGTDFYHPS